MMYYLVSSCMVRYCICSKKPLEDLVQSGDLPVLIVLVLSYKKKVSLCVVSECIIQKTNDTKTIHSLESEFLLLF
jgi:hypothetical protein